MSSHFHTIPVIDGNGDQLIVYEIVERRSLFGLIARKRFSLCAGERVQQLDRQNFLVVATGERLTRV